MSSGAPWYSAAWFSRRSNSSVEVSAPPMLMLETSERKRSSEALVSDSTVALVHGSEIRSSKTFCRWTSSLRGQYLWLSSLRKKGFLHSLGAEDVNGGQVVPLPRTM